jgi:putative ABC transport system substrate-binding protein
MPMNRRRMLGAMCAGLGVSWVRAQPRMARVGLLAAGARPETQAGLTQGLQDGGYRVGRDVALECRYTGGDYRRNDALVQELLRMPVDVILTDGTPATEAALRATQTVPVVFVAGNSLAGGLVSNMAKPTANATGISTLSKEVGTKVVDLLQVLLPNLRRLAVLRNPENVHNLRLQGFVRDALGKRATLLDFGAESPARLEAAFREMKEARADAVFWLGDPFLNAQLARLAELAKQHRLPSASMNGRFADVGGLMSYGANSQHVWRAAGAMAARILRGAKPADLPVEQPQVLELVLNRSTARLLGIEIPPELLLLANRVVE